MAPKLALGVGAVLLAAALPSSVVAIGLIGNDSTYSEAGPSVSFTPASADPRIARIVAERAGGKAPLMRFTPANSASDGSGRAVTVAVRVDQRVAQILSGRTSVDSGRDGGADGNLRLASSRYNLGLSRGYSSFAQAPAQVSNLAANLSSAEVPDLAEFEPSAGAAEKPSRFAARIELEEEAPAGRPANAADQLGDRMLDVGGSYSLTRNLNVTAGVRYQQERDLRPLPDVRQQDSQAVYIGTQFRF
ncbi:hypothetical protein [Aurantiacibacter suaedae]|uniref:hypothetical protein n=1 Tax=Aurantiacibacter suaedae TaxID=2545755 RepID=UPI0010F5DF61|nr:hypothetical protein [Aurantiacibacter suaedae]